MAWFVDDPDVSWERLGRQDAYFGVLTRPHYRAAKNPGPQREEFFRTGEEHIIRLFSIIDECFSPYVPQRALDFGCGVGRIVLPLARRVPEVVGVDVSPSMLEEARRNCRDAGLSNVTLLPSDDLKTLTGRFDLIHSFIVFQHIPPRRGIAIIRRLLDHLAEDGIGALHVVYGTSRPGWRTCLQWLRKHVPLVHPLLNLCRGIPLRYPLMQMNCYPLGLLFSLLSEAGCHRVSLRFSNHGGFLGVLLVFQRHALQGL